MNWKRFFSYEAVGVYVVAYIVSYISLFATIALLTGIILITNGSIPSTISEVNDMKMAIPHYSHILAFALFLVQRIYTKEPKND